MRHNCSITSPNKKEVHQGCYKVAVDIATTESIDPYHVQLLKTAVLYHDLGFIVQATGHEEINDIAHDTLPDFDIRNLKLKEYVT
ncbi:MAG: hypothetical protein U0T81_13495 [Saprospiraceae bacterium]